jgi:hypothetical protein
MSMRGHVIPSFGVVLTLAVFAAGVIYFGAIPWALGRVIGATLAMFGLR